MNYIADESPQGETNPCELNAQQVAAVATLRDRLAKVNAAVVTAVEAGLTIELVRSSRRHSPACTWGDQITPKVVIGG